MQNPLSKSLALRIQVTLGLMVAAIILLGTYLSYRSAIGTLQAEALQALQTTTAARADYESKPFETAQLHTVRLRDRYLQRLQRMGGADPKADFDALFVRYADGLVRVRPELDDYQRRPTMYVRPDIPLDAALRRKILVAYKLLAEWGPVLTLDYYAAYIDLPGISLIMYSPRVNWGRLATPETNNFDYPPVQNASPSRNPARRTLWSEIYFDDKAGIWMFSVVTPLDLDGEWLGAVSQDIDIDELIKRSATVQMPGTYNMIIDQHGDLLAHPNLMEKIHQSKGNLHISDSGDELLKGFAKEVKLVSNGPEVRESPDGRYYLAVAAIKGPQWHFVTVYPKALLEAKARDAAKDVAAVGACLLLALWLALAVIVRRQVSNPLRRLGLAATAVGEGQLDVSVPVSRKDELGRLGERFGDMAKHLQERDNALKARASELEHEIAQRVATEQRLHYMATHDELTGLANRAVMKDRLLQAIGAAQRAQAVVGVLFIDLDRFKQINDTLGHEVGDQVLCQVAAKVSTLLRKSDTLCRLGGDEFVLLLPSIADSSDAVVIAGRIISTLEEIKGLGGIDFDVTACVGVSTYPQDGLDPDTLLRNADIAMYRAKSTGRNRFQSYLPELGERASEALRLDAAIRLGIERNEFVLHFQPKVDSQNRHLTGAEALLRWERPGHGLVYPDSFLPFAAEHRLMPGIDAWVLQAACAQLQLWRSAGKALVPLSVNLSAGHFARPDQAGEIAQMLLAHGLQAQNLILEVTEGALLQEGETVPHNLRALRAMGVRISVDDFGTGYSSLSYLHKLPIDELKIDKSFVSAIDQTADTLLLVRAIVRIGHDLKLSVVAEGVETPLQAQALSDLGCDQLQGYFFYRPMAADAFAALLGAQFV